VAWRGRSADIGTAPVNLESTLRSNATATTIVRSAEGWGVRGRDSVCARPGPDFRSRESVTSRPRRKILGTTFGANRPVPGSLGHSLTLVGPGPGAAFVCAGLYRTEKPLFDGRKCFIKPMRKFGIIGFQECGNVVELPRIHDQTSQGSRSPRAYLFRSAGYGSRLKQLLPMLFSASDPKSTLFRTRMALFSCHLESTACWQR
jgi:hypothetical protein